MNQTSLLRKYPWISIELFENILKNQSGQAIDVVDLNVEAALRPGENYGSQIIRATVKYKRDGSEDQSSESFIIKASLGSEVVRSVNVFEKEIFMFQVIIPKVEKLLNDIGIETKIAPTCFQANVDLSYLILEDLNSNGIRNAQRTTGLDFDHLKVSVSKLSRWHAATATLLKESPEISKLYERAHVNPSGSPRYRDLFENAVSSCAEVFKNVAGFERIAEKLFRLEEKVFERCCTACSRDATQFNVLTHGDMWANNIMYSYDACNKPSDALMIDFQVGYWGSPILDLTYLLFTSSHVDVKDLEWEQLMRLYYDELNTTLMKLSYSTIPTLDDFRVQLVERGIYSAIFALFSVTMRLFDDVEDNSVILKFFIRNENEKQFRVNLMRRPQIQHLLGNLLIYFDKMGFLNA